MQVICGARASAGFTLVEVAIILLIVGLLILSVAKGQQLIGNARVREFLAQQDAVEQAVLAFESPLPRTPGRLRRGKHHNRL